MYFVCRYAVVTGANKGIGFGICKQLASNGIVVLLTARDEKRGLEAVQKLKDSGLSDYLLFHQLDVADQASVDSLLDFVKTHFGKLDILVPFQKLFLIMYLLSYLLCPWPSLRTNQLLIVTLLVTWSKYAIISLHF